MSLNDRRFITQTEELLGHRGVKDNRAVRFRDLKDLNLAATLSSADRAAIDDLRDVVTGVESDLDDVLAAVDAAATAANQAAVDAQNAMTAAGDAQTYADGLVAQVYADMGENFDTMESSLNLIAQAQGRETSCLADPFLVSSDWARLSGEGTLDLLTNQRFPIGRTWQFTVGAANLDGLGITDSTATIWPGQTDAPGYVVEIDYTLLSGSLDGAGVTLVWSSAAPVDYPVSIRLANMQDSAGLAGRARLARAVFVKPITFTGAFAAHRLSVHVNNAGLFAPGAAKTIQIHRVNVRPASREELGQGVVMDSVQAYLSANYLTAAGTDAAIAEADLTVNASLTTTFATVERVDTAIASIDGTVARFRNVATVNGEVRAGIEAVAFDGAGTGTGSVVRLIGDDVIAEGTLSAGKIIVHDGSGNLFPDPAFSLMSLSGWTGNGHAFIYPMRTADIPGSTVKANAPAATVLYLSNHSGLGTKSLTSAKFEALAGTKFDLAFDCAVSGDGSYTHSVNLRLIYFDNTDTQLAAVTGFIQSAAPATWERKNYVATAPAGAVKAAIQINSFDSALTAWACATNFSVIRKRSGQTLITPDSISTDLLFTDDFAAAGLAIFGGDVQSDNFNAGTGVGWKLDSVTDTLIVPNASISTAKIENLAVTGAKMANLTVTTGKIGNLAVDTLKIGDEAVSKFDYAYGAANLQSNSDPFIMQSTVINKSRTQPLVIHASLTVVSTTNATPIGVVQIRDGTNAILLGEFPVVFSDKVGSKVDFYAIDTNTTTGNITYQLRLRNLSGVEVTCSKRFIGALNTFK